jgi:hypothetical protein
MPPVWVKEGEVSSEMVTIEKEHWQVRKVYCADGKTRNYLIRVNDMGICEELFAITNSLIKEKMAKAFADGDYVTKEFFEDIRKNLPEKTKQQIKDLPLWKRVFNKF